MASLSYRLVPLVGGGVSPVNQPMGTTDGESSAREQDEQQTKHTPSEEDDQSTMEALAIQFVLMVCGGVYSAIQPMGANCGE